MITIFNSINIKLINIALLSIISIKFALKIFIKLNLFTYNIVKPKLRYRMYMIIILLIITIK
jgi:hypothetical protein